MNNLIKNQNRDFFRDFLSPAMSNGFNHIFNEENEGVVNFIPNADIKETDTNYLVTLALPGLTKKEVEIEVKENLLVVIGEYNKEESVEGEKFHKKEIRNGSFRRSFRLKNNVDLGAVEATFSNGLLNISIPKKEKEVAKKIAIK